MCLLLLLLWMCSVAAAALNLIASKLNSTVAGLQSALGVVMRGAGITGARLDALTAPLLASTSELSLAEAR
jgi:hypothetical protein